MRKPCSDSTTGTSGITPTALLRAGTGLWPTACLPENWLAAGPKRQSALARPGRGLPSGSVGRRQDRRRPARRPDGVRRPARADGPQSQDEPRRPRPRLRPDQDRGVLRLHDPRPSQQAWTQAGLEPITPHEARHCAISYFIAAGLDRKQISTWAGHGDVRQTWNRYGHLVPGGEEEARERLDAYLTPSRPTSTVAHTVAHDLQNAEPPSTRGF